MEVDELTIGRVCEEKSLSIVSEPGSQTEIVEANLSLIARLEQMDVADETLTTPMSEISAIGYSTDVNKSLRESASDDGNDSGVGTPIKQPRSLTECPIAVPYFAEKRVTELSRYSWRGSSKRQRFLKGCLWSPDGTCILTAVNCDGMHVVELPTDVYDNDYISPDRPLDVLQSAVHINEAGIVYDYCWYPYMNSTVPESCVWLASRQHEPIQMWDAYKGTLRCSYRGYNAVDEVESALSLTFSFDGCDIIAGYKNSLKIFRTDVPGRDYVNVPIKSPASALAANPSDGTIAVGSWTGAISLHDSRHPHIECFEQLTGHRAGVTYLRFIAQRNYLVSGARKDCDLSIWDMRNTAVPVHRLTRTVHTNQRIYFDVSSDESLLVSGDTTGIVRAWNIQDFSAVDELTVSFCLPIGFYSILIYDFLLVSCL